MAAAHRAVVAGVGELAGDAIAVHHDDPVGQRDHLGHVAGDQQDRRALVGQLAQQLVQIGLGLDVDADRRLVDDQDLDPGRQPFRDAKPSAGCRPRGCRRSGRATGVLHLELADEGLDRVRGSLPSRQEAERIGEALPDGDARVLQHGMHQDQPLAACGPRTDIADAVAVQRLRDRADPWPASPLTRTSPPVTRQRPMIALASSVRPAPTRP